MKVLLIATNQADRYMDRMVVRPLPIGLAYIAAYIDEANHELRVLDLMFSSDPWVDVRDTVTEFQPDIVGLSIRNLDNQSYLNPVWHLPSVKRIVGEIRAVSDAQIICGGPAFSILPAECLEYLDVDLGIAGDAAQSFADLVDRLSDGADYNDIPGLVLVRDGRTAINKHEFTSDFSRPPRWDLVDTEKYRKSGFGIGVVTKLAPGYYSYGPNDRRFSGDERRLRPEDEVVDEIRSMRDQLGIRNVFFIDSGFNHPLDHAKNLCRALIDSELPIRWNTYLRPGDCDAELIGLMKQSGCSLALIAGVEGVPGNGALDHGLSQTGKIASLCRQSELPFAIAVTFGDPGETRDTVGKKLEFLKSTKADFATLRVGTRILPGTTFAQAALESKVIRSESELIAPVFYIDPTVEDWIVDKLQSEAREYPRWNLL